MMVRETLDAFSIVGLASRLRNGELSPVALTEKTLARIDETNSSIGAFVAHDRTAALDAARRADQEIRAGRYRGALHGIPFAIKDNILTADLPTTAGTRVHSDRFPSRDATLVGRLRDAGAIIIGKTNMDELAWGIQTPGTRNPRDMSRTAGGSSGGSAASVAAALCAGAIGTDTGGSVRIPASLCGVVGLRPTFGRVSMDGVVVHSWSLDQPGPIARSVADSAIILDAISGYDPTDPSSADLPPTASAEALKAPVNGLRIGICRDPAFQRLEPSVAAAFGMAVNTLTELTLGVTEVHLPNLRHGLGAILTIELASAAAYHDGALSAAVREKVRPEIHTYLELGKMITAVDYLKAEQVRRLIMDDFARAFRSVDAIITPTTPLTAWQIGETDVVIDGERESILEAAWRCTYPFSLAGLPALSVPCGADEKGLPIGLQIAGRPFAEDIVLQIGQALEHAQTLPVVSGSAR